MRFLFPVLLTFYSCSSSSPETSTLGVQNDPEVRAEHEGEGESRQSSPGILAELFTSQGCSSCPPADKLLSSLSKESGNSVIALAYHVDYWNYIGWEDPFSSAQWSSRQGAYARKLAEGRTYTPQLVVNGRAHVVGSRKENVRRLLGAQKNSHSSDIEVSVKALGDGEANSLTLALEVSTNESRQGAELWVAVYENDLVTQVQRGENSGQQLHNDRVVRHLEKLGVLGLGKGSYELAIPMQSGWRREKLGAVSFVQDSSSLQVSYAKELGLLWRGGDANLFDDEK